MALYPQSPISARSPIALEGSDGGESSIPAAAAGPAALVEGLVCRFVDSPANDNGMPGGEPIFGRPLVGFAAGDDPIWDELKRTDR